MARGRDVAKAAGCAVGVRAGRGRRQAGARVGEVRRVEQVEELGAVLHLGALLDRKVLEERKIEVAEAGAYERVAAGVAVGVKGREADRRQG